MKLDMEEIRFDASGLVPAIAQDAATLQVLMLAYMNREALEKTVSTGRAHYWSRSRGELWLKGETSGNFQQVRSVHYDCDVDALLLVVDPLGPACHTGRRTCFYRSLDGLGADGSEAPAGERVLPALFDIIKSRKGAGAEKSYVASLYAGGLGRIIEKVTEESGELVEAALEKGGGEITHELADLWFHTMVLLAERGVELDEVFAEFAGRFGVSGHEEKASRGKGAGKDRPSS
ncbi:MAG: bifunctional phosphoribosyl-AMP cyclohydrolase/phosphoribosyl-ATP diphosphatase HisIE [Thermodesulfobacteriota bacterium]